VSSSKGWIGPAIGRARSRRPDLGFGDGQECATRSRRHLVEEGFEATLTRKYNPTSARPRIFDGAAEAKLIALTCSQAPEGFARWSLRLLEEKVAELNIVARASDNTIGRTLKRMFPHSSGGWRANLLFFRLFVWL
jgi:hypothetical protein